MSYLKFKNQVKTGKLKVVKTATVPVATKKYVRKAIQKVGETKEYFQNSGTSALTFDRDGVLINMMSSITQGTGDDDRIGDYIALQRLKVNMRCVISASSPDVFRVIIFRWKPNNTTPPPISEILYSYVAGSDYQNCMSQYNNKKAQYTILADKFLRASGNGDTAIHALRFNINLKNVKCEYRGTSDTTNCIYMLLLAEGTPTNSYVYNSVLQYKDV